MANQKMWNRNYWNLFSAVFGTFNTSQGTSSTPTHDQPFVKSMDGAYRKVRVGTNYEIGYTAGALCFPNTVSLLSNNMINQFTTSYTPSTMFRLGTGTGELDGEEWDLFSPATTNFAIGTPSYSWSYDADSRSYTKIIKAPVAYSGTNPVNVTEFGVFLPVTTTASNDSTRAIVSACLVYHEVFETPITLEQNDTIEITFAQTIVQPHYADYPATS